MKAKSEQVAAVPEHDRSRRRREEVDEREVDAAVHHRLVVRRPVVLVHLAEVPPARRLARERLDHTHAGDVLGERGRHETEPLSHRPIGAGAPHAEDRRSDRHRRNHRQRRECQSPVEQEQDDGGPDQDQRVLDKRGDSVRDELVERIDVVREPADDHAGAVPLVETQRQALEVLEEPVPEVGEDPLARPAREVGLRGRRDEVRETRDEEQRHDHRERVQVLLADPVVDRELREVGRDECGQCGRQQRHDRQRRPQLVRRRQPRQGRDAARRPLPRPVLDLRVALCGEVGAGLPDLHDAASARASIRSANSRSSRPCS